MDENYIFLNVIFREKLVPLSDQGLKSYLKGPVINPTQRCSTCKGRTRRQRHHWKWLKYNLCEPQTEDSSQISGAQH